jgi:membrane protease YdiL (CAAX protease family)
MFPQLADTAKGVVFYVLAFTLGLVLLALPGVAATEMLLLYYVFTPLLAALLMLLVVTRDGYSRAGWASLGLHRPGVRGWLPALLIPPLVLGCAYGLVWAGGAATFGVSGELLGMSIPTLVGLVLLGIVKSTFTNSLGEELGWRGYLLPRLATLGPLRASLLVGLLHGVWHLPVMLLTSLYHAEGNQLVVIPLFLLNVTAGGALFGYLRFTTDSVWPASLAHSSHNTFWELFTTLTVASTPLASEYLAGESGILPTAGYALVACWLLYRQRSGTPAARLQPAAAA